MTNVTSISEESIEQGIACNASSVSLASMDSATVEAVPDDSHRNSILDFEHLFVQYYVEVRPRSFLGRCVRKTATTLTRGFHFASPRQARHGRRPSISILPTAEEIVEGWKEEAANFVQTHIAACKEKWPELRVSRRALMRQLNEEISTQDELASPKSRVLLTLEPERVCHRLFWALGDELPADLILRTVEKKLQKRWPQCRVRCRDNILFPHNVFTTLFLVFSVLALTSLNVAWAAFHLVLEVSARGATPSKTPYEGPTRQECLDQLAARVLFAGSLLQLWMLYAVASSFPLRSLHSPFRRDLGCLAAYSRTGYRILQIMSPLAALSMPVAMAVRFDRLGLSLLVPKVGQYLGLHSAALCGAAMLPLLSFVATSSVRSSLYSHHQIFISALFAGHLGAALGFAAHFEMVKWAFFSAAALIGAALYLFARYTMEFTNVRLLKAAQLQWACAHIVPLLGLLLAAALEVESGVGRVLVHFICENQDVMPRKMCIRLLRGS
eukprot:TRINITY_DN22594_c0_g1_i1.p1 TRINITY_DN22594_c0_g1~~TRINITY_DN22594_c0_g1_i1.p1  ORF type:complete len:498 (+),score=52.94 TRINITY_DN22594_c0_g1_i1:87-1580(+)